MSLWTIVPVKPFRQGKSRLSGVLSEDERYMLNSTLFGNTLRSLSGVKGIEQILVVSRDSSVLSMSREFGARTIQEEGPSNLNNALTLATSFAVMSGAQKILVIPTDLPLLNSSVIEEIIAKGGKLRQMVISPDRKKDGTNALMVSPADAIEYQYGAGSYQKHLAQANKKGLQIEVYQSKVLELDLDFPEDLDILRQMEIKGLG